jgi:chromosome condensin MukBEF ATPase and DNA-binding subunit MukB
MNRASRLEPIAEFAGKVEDEAARRLAASATTIQNKERELEQLRSYLAEYRQRLEAEQSTDSMRRVGASRTAARSRSIRWSNAATARLIRSCRNARRPSSTNKRYDARSEGISRRRLGIAVALVPA